MSELKSSHVADPFVKPFLQPSFDPASFLNATLPALATSSFPAGSGGKTGAVPLAELSFQTQSLLSQLNAHTARLTAALTQLTEDILRTGGRLAYQVEVLRGETLGLSETLTEGLQSDIAQFVPQSTKDHTDGEPQEPTATGPDTKEIVLPPTAPKGGVAWNTNSRTSQLDQLRTLTQVRDRLESVIKVFGDAMQWTIPPSEISLTSSLISVSAPTPGADNVSREEKGREYAEKLRREIADLVTGSSRDVDAHAVALERIQALRDLAQVWKGTSEEKARIKFVDSLVKLADEKQRAIQRDAEAHRQRQARESSPRKQASASRQTGTDKAMSILDRLYLD